MVKLLTIKCEVQNTSDCVKQYQTGVTMRSTLKVHNAALKVTFVLYILQWIVYAIVEIPLYYKPTTLTLTTRKMREIGHSENEDVFDQLGDYSLI